MLDKENPLSSDNPATPSGAFPGLPVELPIPELSAAEAKADYGLTKEEWESRDAAGLREEVEKFGRVSTKGFRNDRDGTVVQVRGGGPRAAA